MDEMLPGDGPQLQLGPGPETPWRRLLELARLHSSHLIGAGLFLAGAGTGYLARRPRPAATLPVVQASVFPTTAPAAPAGKAIVRNAPASKPAAGKPAARKPAAKAPAAAKKSAAKPVKSAKKPDAKKSAKGKKTGAKG